MVKFIKRLLGIEALEKRVEELEKSQTFGGSVKERPKLSDNVLDEWINGAEENK